MSYAVFAWHCTREEKVGNGGEKQESGGDEKAHPPRTHPAGVTLVQLLFGSCKHGSQSMWGVSQASPSCHYPERFDPHPRRAAEPQSPAGSPQLARRPTPRKGWLQTGSGCEASEDRKVKPIHIKMFPKRIYKFLSPM